MTEEHITLCALFFMGQCQPKVRYDRTRAIVIDMSHNTVTIPIHHEANSIVKAITYQISTILPLIQRI